MPQIVLASTATKIPSGARGGVLLTGSHGGAYVGYLAARAQMHALIAHDAGVGLDRAGIGCLAYCAQLGMAAATAAHTSARIGDAPDMQARGWLSHVNELARGCGCAPGMSVREATQRLVAAPSREASNYPEYPEARHDLGTNRGGLRIVAVDSVSLVESEDAGQVVVSGSHGGVVSGQPSVTISVGAAAAFFNDAGIGIDEAGLGRLPRLDELGIAGATVSAESARIGDGRSTYEDGVVSRANDIAREFGIRVRMAARDAVETIA